MGELEQKIREISFNYSEILCFYDINEAMNVRWIPLDKVNKVITEAKKDHPCLRCPERFYENGSCKLGKTKCERGDRNRDWFVKWFGE